MIDSDPMDIKMKEDTFMNDIKANTFYEKMTI